MARFSGFFSYATFVGGLITGLAGFAMGLVVSGIWLHILTPIQTAALIVGYGLLVQSYSIWKLRHALRWRAVAPFIIGGAVGVPVGSGTAEPIINPAHLRIGVGVLLVFYSIYSLARPVLKPMHAGVAGRCRHWRLNGLLGGHDRPWPESSSPSGASSAADRRTHSARFSSR